MGRGEHRISRGEDFYGFYLDLLDISAALIAAVLWEHLLHSRNIPKLDEH